jgi:hypothetical protein
MINPNPECPREDCRFTHSGGSTTLVAYIPIYDKYEKNINPDRNTTTFKVNCLSCGKMWVGKTCAGETTYEELECNETGDGE